MRLKLMTFFLTLLGVFSALLIFRVSQILDQTQASAESSVAKSQARAAILSFEEQLRHLQKVFYLSWSVVSQEKPEKKDFSADIGAPFLMIGKLAGDPSQALFEERYFQSKSEVAAWAASYIPNFLKSVKTSELHVGSVSAFALLDPQRRPYGLLVFTRLSASGGVEYHTALTPPDLFQGLLDQQKGQSVSMILVNSMGQVLAHPTRDYVGTSMKEDPAVNAALNGSGDSSSLSSSITGSNLVLVASAMEAPTAQKFLVQIGLLALGLLLVGGVGLYYFYKPEKEIVTLNQPLTGVQKVTAGPEISPAQAEKIKSIENVAASLAHELMAPCTSILGHARLAWARLEQNAGTGKFEEIRFHLQKLEDEARASRAILQKLLTFAGEDKEEPTRAQVDTVVLRALQSIESLAQNKGIKIHRKLETSAQMLMPLRLFTKAIESLLQNSVEAMERAPKKELTLELTSDGENSILKISDTGEGISPQNLAKIFDPFFTTKSQQRHTGLGLATVLGVVKELQGEIDVQSELGRGTTVQIRWPHSGYEQYLSRAEGPMPTILPAVPKAPLEAIKEVLAKPESADLPAVVKTPLEPLLVDDSVEKMLDEDITVSDETMKIDLNAMDLPAFLPDEQAADLNIPNPENKSSDRNGFSSKIDRPHNIPLRKKPSKLDSVAVSIPKAVNKGGESS